MQLKPDSQALVAFCLQTMHSAVATLKQQAFSDHTHKIVAV